jgi:hypothetical protein
VINGNQTFPRWAGPVIGAAIGVEIGVHCMIGGGQDAWLSVIAGALAGTLGGSLLGFIDTPAAEERPASIIGSIFTVLAAFSGIVPIAGLVFGIPAFVLNRRVAGWQNRASRLGLGLCIVLTLVVFGTIVGLRR